MTVHRDRFLLNKTNRRTEFQFYWYYDSTCFGQSFCPSSGVLAVHRHWYNLCSLVTECDQAQDQSMEWVAITLTLPLNVVYPALLTLTRTPRLPAVDWTDAPADLNRLVRFGERRNLVSARVPSRFKRGLHAVANSYGRDVTHVTSRGIRLKPFRPNKGNGIFLQPFKVTGVFLHLQTSSLTST
jgi:hypothetical protein